MSKSTYFDDINYVAFRRTHTKISTPHKKTPVSWEEAECLTSGVNGFVVPGLALSPLAIVDNNGLSNGIDTALKIVSDQENMVYCLFI